MPFTQPLAEDISDWSLLPVPAHKGKRSRSSAVAILTGNDDVSSVIATRRLVAGAVSMPVAVAGATSSIVFLVDWTVHDGALGSEQHRRD